MEEVLDRGDAEVLGKGGFATVTVAKARRDGKAYALKTIPKQKPGMGFGATLRYQRMLKREVELHRKVSGCFHVVTLYDVFEDDDAVHLQLELCEGGSLLEHWHALEADDAADGNFPEGEVREIAREVLQVVAQMHDRDVAFRDIKPENFMYTQASREGVLKLTDFGLALELKMTDPPYTNACGTPAFVAPEVLRHSAHLRADEWSAGVLIYQLLAGHLPFRLNAQLLRSIQSAAPDVTSPPWDGVSQEAKDVVLALLTKDPSSRATAQAALRMPWFAGPRRPLAPVLLTST